MGLPNSRVAVAVYGILMFMAVSFVFYYTVKFIRTGNTMFDGMAKEVKQVEPFESAKTVTVAYYTLNGCPHCTAFNPEWSAFEKKAKIAGGITTMKYDAREDRKEVEAAGVDGFPTIIITKNGKTYTYQGERTSDALMTEVK